MCLCLEVLLNDDLQQLSARVRIYTFEMLLGRP